MAAPDDSRLLETASPVEPPPVGAGCPPPLRCRDISAALDELASAWELTDSPVGTRGWCWGHGRPLYLLNGCGRSARLFALFAWLLRDQFRCMLVDWKLPARGPRPPLQTYADDLLRLISEYEDEPVGVVAGSFGSAVALQAAARQPAHFERLILQDVRCQYRLSLPERVLTAALSRSRRSLGDVPWYAKVQTLNHRRWFPPLDPDRWQWFLEVTGEIPLALVISQMHALDKVSLSDDLKRVTCPVLLIEAEGSGPNAAAEQKRVAAQLPQAWSAAMHTTGQLPYLTHPHRFMKLVQQFYDDPESFAIDPDKPTYFPLKSS